MPEKNEPQFAHFEDIRDGIDQSQEVPFSIGFSVGDLTALVYTPGDIDHQEPHDQDEIYIVITGTAGFEVSGRRQSVKVGDAVYVPAKADHRFLHPSDDFSCWAIFANSGLPAAPS